MKLTDVVDISDPGDDVIRRFRFQFGYAALKAIDLLDPNSIACCIYCEHHEDVLIELKSGKFIGVQIKTREVGLSPFKSSDPSIFGALVRFCKEDANYPKQFSGFGLVTNGAFFRGEGADDLHNLIRCAQENPCLKGLLRRNSLKPLFEKIATAAALPLSQVIATIAKIELEEMLTGIDLDLLVVQALSELDGCAEMRHMELLTAARLLSERIFSASSKAHQFVQLQANAITLDITARATALTIANKRIDGGIVRSCLDEAVNSARTAEQELLTIHGYLHRDGTPASLSRMEAKMAVGNLSVMEVEEFKDDVRSLEGTFIRWKEKYSLGEANVRLQHVQSLTLRQCRAEHDPTQAPKDFRQPIVTDRASLRSRITNLSENEAPTLFGCRIEHLFGAVGMLTDECRVWWSPPFDLEGKL